MDINSYKDKFKDEFLYDIEELSIDQASEIPKGNKAEEYKYLNERGYFFLDGKYYHKVKVDMSSNDDLSLLSQIKILDLLKKMSEDIDDVKSKVSEVDAKLRWASIFMVIIIIVLNLILIF